MRNVVKNALFVCAVLALSAFSCSLCDAQIRVLPTGEINISTESNSTVHVASYGNVSGFPRYTIAILRGGRLVDLENVIDWQGNLRLKCVLGPDVYYDNRTAIEEFIETVGGDNIVLCGDGKSIVFGGSGMDLMLGGTTDDLLVGGDGRDWLVGDEGDDVLCGGQLGFVSYPDFEADILAGGYGDDTFYAFDEDRVYDW